MILQTSLIFHPNSHASRKINPPPKIKSIGSFTKRLPIRDNIANKTTNGVKMIFVMTCIRVVLDLSILNHHLYHSKGCNP